MTIDPKLMTHMYAGCHSRVAAITAHHEGRDNGLIVLSGAPGSVLNDAPRLMISISKPNFTHDMVMKSGAFAMHFLSMADEAAMARSADIVTTLAGTSGRDGNKMGALEIKRGVTGCPILTGALMYAECRVAKTFDGDESSYFLGDVVALERLSKGWPMDSAALWKALPHEWIESYEAKHEETLCAKARIARGLA